MFRWLPDAGAMFQMRTVEDVVPLAAHAEDAELIDPNSGTILVLQRTQPWVRLASFIGFLLAALMAFLGFDGTLGGLTSRRFETAPFLLLDFLFSFAFLVPSLYLHKYASRIGVFVAQGHNVQLEAALEAQRKFWKFTGLFALLSLIVLTVAAGLALI